MINWKLNNNRTRATKNHLIKIYLKALVCYSFGGCCTDEVADGLTLKIEFLQYYGFNNSLVETV